MVKNFGGNKSKRGGRKHQKPVRRGIRYIEEEGEIYAAVTKLFGGGGCEVICADGAKRFCVIRKKFKGRGKRDNLLTGGVWVLVGVRDWEVRCEGKMQKCDLLEVYSEADKEKLKQSASCSFTALLGVGEDDNDDVVGELDFVDEKTSAYQAEIENAFISGGGAHGRGGDDDDEEEEEEIDVDDI